MTRFDICADIVFEREGGFVNHPRDNGGATNLGVTIGTLRKWRGEDVTVEDVRNLTKDEARKIYHDWYWESSHAGSFRAGVDLVVFDAAIHAGPKAAIGFLQGSIGAVVDGIVGPETKWKASQKDPIDIISDFIDLRLAHLRAHEDWDVFGRGWTNRLNHISAEAVRMARSDTGSVSIAGTEQDGRLLRAYRLARAEIGEREIPGPQHNPKIVDWFRRVGGDFIKDDETAWCAAFQGAMLEAAGLRSTRALNARSYMEWGEPTNDPKEGDIVVFWRVAKRDWRGHVGFFVRREGDRILTLGGNQNDAVSEKWYPINARTYGLLGYRTMRVPIEQENNMSDLIDQPTSAPTRKLTWASVAALVSASLTPWLMETIPFLAAFNETDLESMVATAIVTVATFATGYFVRERA